jgi:hypothetical protein
MTDPATLEGVARIQYERDVESALSDIGKLVDTHGLSWEQDAFYELEVIVREAVGLPVPATGGTDNTKPTEQEQERG